MNGEERTTRRGGKTDLTVYRDLVGHYADVAHDGEADVLVIGSELISAEAEINEWTKTIRMIRRRFAGQITYCANWDHCARTRFWDQLGFSMDCRLFRHP